MSFEIKRAPPVLKLGEGSTGAAQNGIIKAPPQVLAEPVPHDHEATASDKHLIEEEPTSVEDEEGIISPQPENHKGGVGPPLTTQCGGKSKEIHDGGGLRSPGRWIPGTRRRYVWTRLPAFR